MEIMPSIPKPFYITRKLTTSKHLNMFYVPSAPVFLLQLQNIMIYNFDYIMFVANLLVFLLCILSDSHPEG